MFKAGLSALNCTWNGKRQLNCTTRGDYFVMTDPERGSEFSFPLRVWTEAKATPDIPVQSECTPQIPRDLLAELELPECTP